MERLPSRTGDGGAFANFGHDLLSARALQILQEHIDRFPSEFLAYLPDNLHVYEAFEREALKVVRRGLKHYSARTIIEVLRHNSALAEVGGAWKLNDWHTPYLARVFMLLHPEQKGLFEFRVTKMERVAA